MPRHQPNRTSTTGRANTRGKGQATGKGPRRTQRQPGAGQSRRSSDAQRQRRNPDRDSRRDTRGGSRSDTRGDARRGSGRDASRTPKSWGGVARRGADKVTPRSGASDAWRDADRRAHSDGSFPDRDRREDAPPAEPWEPEEWIDEGLVRDEAEQAVARSSKAPDRRTSGPRKGRDAEPGTRRRQKGQGSGSSEAPSYQDELRNAAGARRSEYLSKRLRAAANAFERGRYKEAVKDLRPLAEAAPQAPSVRELHGLTLYRLGRWRQAAKELEALRTLTGGVEQHPVLADCYRALGRYADAEALWDELRAASPDGALLAEGRIVAAGALADQGQLNDAISLLRPAIKPARRAKSHHVRTAYALADLYERAGDLPRAREMFQRVASQDPDFVDVAARLRALD